MLDDGLMVVLPTYILNNGANTPQVVKVVQLMLDEGKEMPTGAATLLPAWARPKAPAGAREDKNAFSPELLGLLILGAAQASSAASVLSSCACRLQFEHNISCHFSRLAPVDPSAAVQQP